MEDVRYPEELPDYRRICRPGRPLNGLLEGYNREAQTGHWLNFVTRRIRRFVFTNMMMLRSVLQCYISHHILTFRSC